MTNGKRRRTYHWYYDYSIQGLADTMAEAVEALEQTSGHSLRDSVRTVSCGGVRTNFYLRKKALNGRRYGEFVGCIDRVKE